MMVGMITLSLITSIPIFRVQIDDDFVRYLPSHSEFRRNTEFANDRLLGFTRIELWVGSDGPNEILQDPVLESTRALVEFLRNQSAVRGVLSAHDVAEYIHERIGNDAVPIETALFSQYLLLSRLSVDRSVDTHNLVDPTMRHMRISVLLEDVPTSYVRSLDQNLRNWWANRDLDHVSFQVTGEAIPNAYLSTDNLESVLSGLLVTLTVICISLGIVYRNARTSVVAMLAIMVPAIMGFGIWSLFDPTFGIATTAVLAVVIGIVVDDAVHLTHFYHDAKSRLRLDDGEAAGYSMYRVGTSLCITTFVLCIGFSVLLLSDFEVNRTFGGSTALILFAALIFDFCMILTLLKWTTRKLAPFRDGWNT